MEEQMIQPDFEADETEKDQFEKKILRKGILLGVIISSFCFLIGLLLFSILSFSPREKNVPVEVEENNDVILNAETENKIALIENAIETYYYDYKEEPPTIDTMRKGIYDGLVASLNDTYAAYFSAEELEEMMNDNEGIYYGIGAYISISNDTGYPVISGIIENTPAEAVGLRAEDIIYKVEDESTYGWALEDVVAQIKGEEGTYVHLTIYREGEPDYLEMDVVRARVESETVGHEMLEDNIGYILIKEFDGVTVNQFASAYQDVRDQGAQGLIIDLRSNPGGLLTAVLDIGRQILPEGLIVYTEDKNGLRKEYACDGSSEIDIPLVVLVNGYSASASEILSGAVKDYGIGTLVGTTTFGKGIVQNTHMFSDGSAIKLTEKAYFTPKGNYIQGIGIEPDVEVELDIAAFYEDGTDSQLEKAIEIIKSKQ